MNFSMHYVLFFSLALYACAACAYLFRARRAAMAILVVGFAAQTVYQAWRAFMTGAFIVNNIFDPVQFLPWCIAFLIVLNIFNPERREEWLSALIILALFSAYTAVYPKGIIPPTPKKVNTWAAVFFLTEVMAHSFFFTGAWFAWRQRKKPQAECFYHTLIIWGFLIYSVTQVTGAVWSYVGWGTTFRWGSRHLFSAVMWCYFALYIHLRYMQNWAVERRARFAAFGGIVTLVLSFASYVHEMFFPRIGG